MFDIFFDSSIRPVSERCNPEGCTSKSEGCKKEGCKSEGCKKEGCKSEGCKSEGCKKEGCKSEGCDVSKIKRRSVKEFQSDRQREIEETLKNERLESSKCKSSSCKSQAYLNDEKCAEENIIKDAKDKFKKKKNKLMKKLNAKKNTKRALVAECIYKMFNDSLGLVVNTGTNYELMKRNLVESFVMSKDIDTLLEQMKETSLPLYDMATLCEQSLDKIFEEVCDDEYIINSKEKDNFYGQLKTIYTDDISDLVKTRVMNSIEDFTQQNRNLKADLEENLKKTQEKINNSDMTDDIKESFELQAKRENTLRIDKTVKNIFHCMVENISYATVNNNEMKCYMEADTGRLDMVKIVENAKVMYTFMELLNTSKLEKIDEAYVKDALNSLK